MTASQTATPQFYTPDDVQAAVAADFAYRGIDAVVEVGDWSPEAGRGEPRVWIDYLDGELLEPAGHYMPGPQLSPPGTTKQIAAPILDDAQVFSISIHAPPTGADEAAAASSRRATDGLLRATFAALRRALGSPFRRPVRVRWPRQIDGYEGFVRGSLAVCEVVLASPILDDAFALLTVTSAGTDVEFQYPDGTTTPPEEA